METFINISNNYWLPLFFKGVCNKCRISNSRAFHESRLISAQLSPSITRKKRALERQTRANSRGDYSYDCDASLPPIGLLNVAYKTGVLSLEPERVLLFLRRYQSFLTQRPSRDWQQKLYTEFNVTSPKTITLIAAILRRCKTKPQKSLGKTLMLSASAMGDKTATFEIISSALRSNVIHNYQQVLSQLKKFANNGDQQAMMLLGKVLFYTSQSEKNTLSWLRKANHPPTGNLDFDGAGESLVLEGRVLQKMGDIPSARSAFEKAAKELDDPEAYFYLSQMEQNASLIQQTYLLKAAIAGITEAWYNLGVIELDKIKKATDPKKIEDFGMAREWFLVAAYDGNGPSMLNLAIMYKMIGNSVQAFEWLEKASSVPNVSVESKSLWEEWKATEDT